MKKLTSNVWLIAAAIATSIYSCKKGQNTSSSSSSPYSVNQTNLVSDVAGLNAAKVDPNLINAWGLAVNPAGVIWVSSNKKSLSTVYDSTGQTLMAPVTIPSFNATITGAPSGIVYNGTADFGGNLFIFAGETGRIAAWAAGANAALKVDRSAQGAVYKGLAIAADGAANFIYAANFSGGKIDVFDSNFNLVTTKPFTDATIPAGFAPFNIQNIGGMLYVTYAKQSAPDNVNDVAGAGNGFVNIFKPDGTFVQRFASNGTLNSPWGITQAPAGFAAATATILVGNFGDGRINVFDLNGNYKGQLQNNGSTVIIAGLWALDFLKANASITSRLYFTAGPGGESHGVLGYLRGNVNASGNTNNGNGNSGNGGYPGY